MGKDYGISWASGTSARSCNEKEDMMVRSSEPLNRNPKSVHAGLSGCGQEQGKAKNIMAG